MADPFAPTPGDAVCTEIYGGPAVAEVEGLYRCETVNAKFTRTDGCEIGRWDRHAFLFLRILPGPSPVVEPTPKPPRGLRRVDKSDTESVSLLFLAGAAVAGFAAGALLGRWWLLAPVPLVGALVWKGAELEGSLDAWVTFVLSVVLAVAIASGIGFHWIRTRSR